MLGQGYIDSLHMPSIAHVVRADYTSGVDWFKNKWNSCPSGKKVR